MCNAAHEFTGCAQSIMLNQAS
uniref:Uncharacterized protein n=1 Tax=Anguilla anguilla TaxID=7936 RepID=A0A0E9URF1_ANGAN